MASTSARSRSRDLRDYVERTFRHVAETKELDFAIELDAGPAAVDLTDAQAAAAGPQEPAVQRLQVHRAGQRRAARSRRRTAGWSAGQRDARTAPSRWSPSRSPTPASASRRTSSRSSSRRSSRPTAPRAASTAAPAWACRSAARSPGCSAARSGSRARPGEGSTFTLYLPQTYVPPQTARRSLAPCRTRNRQIVRVPMPTSTPSRCRRPRLAKLGQRGRRRPRRHPARRPRRC